MQFRITSQIPVAPVREVTPQTPEPIDMAARTQTAKARETICRTCDWLAAERCARPCPICPLDHRRDQPWARMPKCPENRWK